MNKATVIEQASGFAVLYEGYVQGVFADYMLAVNLAFEINAAHQRRLLREEAAA